MAKSPKQKMKLLYLRDLLLERTDEEHGLTVAEMIAYLEENDISAERKSIYDDLETLQAYGLKIEKIRDKQHKYAVMDREFQLPELKILIDVVQCAKFLTPKKSSELIKKIGKLASKHQEEKLRREVTLANRVKNENESIYYNVDKIHDSIQKKSEISFKYSVWKIKPNVEGRLCKEYKRNGERYTVKPVALTWDNTRYYLIAYENINGTDVIKHFRVDKMKDIVIENTKAEFPPEHEKFNITEYCNSSFGMFGGEKKKVRLRISNERIGVVADRFGDNIFIVPDGENHFQVELLVQISPQFWSWVFGLGCDAKVISPQELVCEYKTRLNEVLAEYN